MRTPLVLKLFQEHIENIDLTLNSNKIEAQINLSTIQKKKEFEFGSKKLYGDIGTTFIFDAGNMLHRGLEGGNRLMFQINLTCSFTNKSGTSNWTSEKILDAIGKKTIRNISKMIKF